jgi:hypothetical protein
MDLGAGISPDRRRAETGPGNLRFVLVRRGYQDLVIFRSSPCLPFMSHVGLAGPIRSVGVRGELTGGSRSADRRLTIVSCDQGFV